jgi:cysteine-rich repeat protein
MASITKWLAITTLAIAACAGNPSATECATGITCPSGTKCAAVQPICITTSCGDGIQQSSEKCDDGNLIDGDGCSADCKSLEICGDGIISAAAGEVCDDGNALGGDGCAADCKSVEVCGNGIRDVGEACDDGNTVPGDGCSGNCRSTEICGNGIVDINEKCDDGGAPGGCNDDCQGGTGCGDGAIDRDGNGNPLEECDDGNNDNQDDCTNTCKLNRCGDGIVQTSGSRIEGCDPSVNFGETSGCNIDCTIATCGDGKINKARGEQCDDQNQTNEDACKNDCTLNICGDGVEGGPNEACDDGGDSLNCDLDCSIKECGDGYVNHFAGEECDSGGVNTAECDANCTIPICGDGTVNGAAGEECDDMNTDEEDNCLSTCKLNTCGDGFRDREGALTEACDDGNTVTEVACDYGTQSCTHCNASCTAVLTLTGNVCGDGNRDTTHEACDDGNRITETACPYGQPTCTLCSANCQLELNLTGAYCGDGTVQASAGEACDDRSPTQSCGRCNNACSVFTAAAVAATGIIVAPTGAALHNNNDRFTLADGFGETRIFQFFKSGSSNADDVKITVTATDTAQEVRDKIKAAINTSGIGITATDAGTTGVQLTNDKKSALGNQAIADTVGTSQFYAQGMTGGAAGDCPTTTPCTHNDDCMSGKCTSNACE